MRPPDTFTPVFYKVTHDLILVKHWMLTLFPIETIVYKCNRVFAILLV
jgi:hypothetical protein